MAVEAALEMLHPKNPLQNFSLIFQKEKLQLLLEKEWDGKKKRILGLVLGYFQLRLPSHWTWVKFPGWIPSTEFHNTL